MVRAIAIRPDDARRSDFRRLLVISGVLHVLGLIALAWAPGMPNAAPPGAIAVDLVAAPPLQAAPAKPKPKAETPKPEAPAPKPKPKPPKNVPKVLPTEPTTPKPVAKPKPSPEPVAKPEPAAEPEEKDLSDILADLRTEAGEQTVEPTPEPPKTAALGAGGTGPPMPVSPEVLAWIREARIRVRQNWVVPPNFQMESLVTEVEVDLDGGGNVRGTPSVTRRSGNPWYDEGVVRSIQKATPLPAPPSAGRWSFVFVSDEDL